jgi:UDP-N-acetyl-D-galactosamine dehydrogenase
LLQWSGLGYVGLPLAVEFGKKIPNHRFSICRQARWRSLRRHVDPTGEVSTADLKAAIMLDGRPIRRLWKEADFIIVAVPTPVDDAHQPDFSPLVGSSEAVGRET